MPTKRRIQYRYTPTGQRSALIDPDGGRFTYTYGSVKRLTQVINRSERGQLAQQLLPSITRTCRKLAKERYDFLRQTLCSKTPIPLYTSEAGR